MAKDTISGLQYLHSKMIIQMDLKTANLLVTDTLHIKISDFGCSKLVTPDYTPKNNTLIGTPFYIAPELIKKPNDFSVASDMYALGIIYWELFEENTKPFIKEHPELLQFAPIQIPVKIHGQNYRPCFNKLLQLQKLKDMITNLWHIDPDTRLYESNKIIEKLDSLIIHRNLDHLQILHFLEVHVLFLYCSYKSLYLIILGMIHLF